MTSRKCGLGEVSSLGRNGCITDVEGIAVGHYTDRVRGTGCTVVLCEGGAVGGVDVRGGAPGTRETDALRPTNLVSQAHAVLLTGGSAFGLDAASGVVRYLAERGIGYPAGRVRVPIVPAAVLFDLGIGLRGAHPRADDGYAACLAALADTVEVGSVGVGVGATVAKALGRERAVMGGVGAASVDIGGGSVVGALIAVNALGGIYDPANGALIAGPRNDDGGMVDPMRDLTSNPRVHAMESVGENTTIGVVATNAALTKEQANRLASIAHDGLALSVRPAHTMLDGDAIFALATGTLGRTEDMLRLGAAAALCVSRAIMQAVRCAAGRDDIPSVSDMTT